AIRERAKKQAVKRPKTAEVSATTIIENVAQTKKLAETNLGDSKVSKPLSLEPPRIDEEKPTNNTSNSPEEEEDEYDQMVVNDDEENCHVIENLRAEDVLLQPLKEKKE
ncbi:Dopamine D2-like receptor, partial [Armadillidium vulgare]